MTEASPHHLTACLLNRYGPTLGGRDLYAALGYKTYAAFHRSRQLGAIGVKVFTLPGRRGWFALTTDVAAWLEAHADETSANLQPENVRSVANGGIGAESS